MVEDFNVQDHIHYYIRLKKGNSIRLSFRDGQFTKTLTPKDVDGIKISAKTWGIIRNDDRIELVREVIEAGAEELVVDERIHESMVASYELQLKEEKRKIIQRDKVINRLKKKISDIQRDLSNPSLLNAKLILAKGWRSRVPDIEALKDPETLRAIIKEITEKRNRTSTDTNCLNAARVRLAEIEKKVEKLKEPEIEEEEEVIVEMSEQSEVEQDELEE